MTHAGITSMTRYFGKNRGKAISIVPAETNSLAEDGDQLTRWQDIQ